MVKFVIHHFHIDHKAACLLPAPNFAQPLFPISPGYYSHPKRNQRQWYYCLCENSEFKLQLLTICFAGCHFQQMEENTKNNPLLHFSGSKTMQRCVESDKAQIITQGYALGHDFYFFLGALALSYIQRAVQCLTSISPTLHCKFKICVLALHCGRHFSVWNTYLK